MWKQTQKIQDSQNNLKQLKNKTKTAGCIIIPALDVSMASKEINMEVLQNLKIELPYNIALSLSPLSKGFTSIYHRNTWASIYANEMLTKARE